MLGLHTGRPLPSPDLLTISFEVDDIAATYQQLRGRGVEFTKRPETAGGEVELPRPLTLSGTRSMS